MTTIKISLGKLGFFLSVNGKAIKLDKNEYLGVKATPTPKANNWIATEFDSIKSLKAFWDKYRILILEASK